MTRIAALVCLLAAPVAAQTPCMARGDMVAALAVTAQQPHFVGLDRTGALLELYAAPDGRWTLTATNAQLVACIVAAGVAATHIPGGKPA